MTSSTQAQLVMDPYMVPPNIQTQRHAVTFPLFPEHHYSPPEMNAGDSKSFPPGVQTPFEESERLPLAPSFTCTSHSSPDTQQWLIPTATPNSQRPYKSTIQPRLYSIPPASTNPYHDFDLDGAHMTLVSISRARRYHPYGNPRRLGHLDILPRLTTTPQDHSHALNYNGLLTPVSTPPSQNASTGWSSHPTTQLQPKEFSGNEPSAIMPQPQAAQDAEFWRTFPPPQPEAFFYETYNAASDSDSGGMLTPATSTGHLPIEEYTRSVFSPSSHPTSESGGNFDLDFGFDTDFSATSATVSQAQHPQTMMPPALRPPPQQDLRDNFHHGKMSLAVQPAPNARHESTSTPGFIIVEPASGRAPRQRQRVRTSPSSPRRRSDGTPKASRPCLVRDGDLLCSRVFETVGAFIKHFKDEHDAPGSHDDKTKVTCAWEGCGSQLQNGGTLRHLKEHISGVICTECGGMYARTDTFNIHWRKRHPRIDLSATSSIMVLV